MSFIDALRRKNIWLLDLVADLTRTTERLTQECSHAHDSHAAQIRNTLAFQKDCELLQVACDDKDATIKSLNSLLEEYEAGDRARAVASRTNDGVDV